ncbi:MAG: sulfite exporter TauE/SafE family protein [Acidimicrobiales bacterium]
MNGMMAAVAGGWLGTILTLALGVLTGAMSGAFGVGGAIVSTPGVRLLGASTFVAVGTTLPSILPGALVGSARYRREGLIDGRILAIAAPGGVVAAVAGSLASHAVPGDGHWLMVLTAALLGLTAVRMARAAPPADGGESGPRRPAPALSVVAIGVVAGLLSGLLGVGGGLVLVPGFSEVLGLRLKAAIATSLACVGILALPGTLTHAVLGDIDWRLALLLTVGAVPGVRLGAAAALATGDRRLRLAVAVGLGLVALLYGGGELAALLSA